MLISLQTAALPVMAPAPHQRKAEVSDEPSEPHGRNRRPPHRYRDGSKATQEPNNPPVPAAAAEVPNPAVKQMHCCQGVDSGQDAEYFDIDDHSEVDEDSEEGEDVQRPIPRACAPQGQPLPSPMDMVNSVDPLESTDRGGNSNAARDIKYFFERNKQGAKMSVCRKCRKVCSLHVY